MIVSAENSQTLVFQGTVSAQWKSWNLVFSSVVSVIRYINIFWTQKLNSMFPRMLWYRKSALGSFINFDDFFRSIKVTHCWQGSAITEMAPYYIRQRYPGKLWTGIIHPQVLPCGVSWNLIFRGPTTTFDFTRTLSAENPYIAFSLKIEKFVHNSTWNAIQSTKISWKTLNCV